MSEAIDCINAINEMPHGVIAILGSGKTFKSGTLYSLFDHYVSYLPDFDQVLILDKPPSWYGYDQSHALRYYKLRKEKKEESE